MVNVNATTSRTGLFLVLENTNLYDLPRYATDTVIENRSGQSLGGIALGDVIDYRIVQGSLASHIIWNGSGLTQDGAGDVTGGLLTSIIGTQGLASAAQGVVFSMTGLNISAAAYWNTLETPTNRSDDVALMLRAFAGNDSFRLSAYGDQVSAGAGDDTIFGNAGADRLRGGSGADRIEGGSGSDRLFGEAGDDRLQGGAGNDRLYGDTGLDTMTGGQGADVFVFHGLSGNDLITDFNGLRDKILIESGAGSINDISMSAERGRLTLSFGQTVITLTGSGLGSFDDSDILFL